MLNIFEQEQYKEYCIRRLARAWTAHKTIIICVDYDNTILAYNDFEKKICDLVVSTIKRAQDFGIKLILYTCREGSDLVFAVEHCKQLGLHFDDINPQKPFQPHMSCKPYCNIMLDDKGGLLSALDILIGAIELYEQYD